MRELAPGLWHWQARHPQWRPTEPWSENVSSYAIDDGKRLLPFDPLRVPGELEELAARRETAIVLTAPWHERDAQGLVERLGVPVYTPLPGTAEYLMETFGLTRRGGAPDVVWLLREGRARRGSTRPAPASVGRRRVPRAQAERHGALDREPAGGELRRSSTRPGPPASGGSCPA